MLKGFTPYPEMTKCENKSEYFRHKIIFRHFNNAFSLCKISGQ